MYPIRTSHFVLASNRQREDEMMRTEAVQMRGRDGARHVVRVLDALKIGLLTLLEPNAKDLARGAQIEQVAETLRPKMAIPLIVNTGFDKVKAEAVLAAGHADLVAFGVPFIANPDLVARFRKDAPLNTPNPALFYSAGNVNVVLLFDCGHFVPEECPETVIKQVLALAAKLPA
jgi:2,4-dienoyl-CoA reductase-like NADH-dependent reductase (Old Yellow Enzyme family)